MFKTRNVAAAAILSLLPATAAFAGVDNIAKVDVSVDISAVNNAEAAKYWANLETDLENAIAARVVDRLAVEEVKPDDQGRIDGAQIMVDVREVELTSAFDRALNLGDAVLVGQVTIVDDTDNSNADGYELTVSLQNAQVVVPEGAVVILSTDTTGAYTRLVDAFADGIVSRLK